MKKIIDVALIRNCDPHKFVEEVQQAIEKMENKGLVVEVKYNFSLNPENIRDSYDSAFIMGRGYEK
jgi:hypothetical protein